MKKLCAILLIIGWAPLAGATGVSLVLSAPQTLGGGAVTLRVALGAAAPTGGATVLLTSSQPGVAFADPATNVVLTSVIVPAGARSRDVAVRTTPVVATVAAQLTAAVPTGKAAIVLNVLPPSIVSMQLAADSAIGGNRAAVTVMLNGRAPRGGYTVGLSSKTLPLDPRAGLIVPEGATGANAQFTTLPVPAPVVGEVTASASGGTASARLTLFPPAITAVSLSPAAVAGLATVNMTITASHQAPAAGLPVLVQRASPLPQVELSLPASVVIPGGQQAVTVPLTVRAPDATAASEVLTATTASGRSQATLRIDPLRVIGIGLSAAEVRGGDPLAITVTRNGVSVDPANAVVTLAHKTYYLYKPAGAWNNWASGVGALPYAIPVSMGANATSSVTVNTGGVLSEPYDVWVYDSALGIQDASGAKNAGAGFRLRPIRATSLEVRQVLAGVTQPGLLGNTIAAGTALDLQLVLETQPPGQLFKKFCWMNCGAAGGGSWYSAANQRIALAPRLVPASTAPQTISWAVTDAMNETEVQGSFAVPAVAYGVQLSSTSLRPGQEVTGVVTVNAPPAAVPGLAYVLESSNPLVASVTTTGVTVPAGSNTAAFTVRAVSATAPTQVVIKVGGNPADYSTGVHATLTVVP